MDEKVNMKARTSDHADLIKIMARLHPWQVEALDEIGFKKWTLLKEKSLPEDLDLIANLLLNFNTRTGKLRVYGREYEVTKETFGEYLGLNSGTDRSFASKMASAAKKKKEASLVDDARFKSVKEEFTKEIKKGKFALSAAKCLNALENFQKVAERPADSEVLRFQRCFFWTLVVDVLFTTAGRFVSPNWLAVETAEDIKNGDWTTQAWDYMMGRIFSWQEKADKVVAGAEDEDDHASLGRGKKRKVPGEHINTRKPKSKKVSAGDGPSKSAEKTSKKGKEVVMLEDEDEDAGGEEKDEEEGGEGNEYADDEGEAREGGDDASEGGKKGQRNRKHCGGFVLFFQVMLSMLRTRK